MATPINGTTLELTELGSGSTLPVRVRRLIIAGYTGRDQTAVRAHIDELAAIGVPAPPRTPMFYEIPTSLLTTEPAISVDGDETSGEVEPVLVRTGGRTYLGVGSDHTDREVEKADIAKSKASAPKPLSATVVALDQIGERWDELELSCRVDGELYQQGLAAALLPPTDLLGKLAADETSLEDGDVMFCGTLPLLGGTFVFGEHYELALLLDDLTLAHTYRVGSQGE